MPDEKIKTFLMFEGKAEEAMTFYASLFPDSEITDVTRYGKDDDGPEGTIKVARFKLNGQTFMCIDSPASHAFTFTPSISLFVDCGSEKELDTLFRKLSGGGEVLMPLDAYPFSTKFGWVADRYGVSWQLNLA